MKKFFADLFYDFMDSGIPSIAFFVGMIAILIFKPIIFLWIFAAIGVYAIITILGANFTGG